MNEMLHSEGVRYDVEMPENKGERAPLKKGMKTQMKVFW
jgi:hypothetical protein